MLSADISGADVAFLSSHLFLTATWAAPCQAGLELQTQKSAFCEVTRSERMKPGAQDGTGKSGGILVPMCALQISAAEEDCSVLVTSLGRFLFPGCVKGFVFLCTKQRTGRSSGLCTQRVHTPQGITACCTLALWDCRAPGSFPWPPTRDSISCYQLSLCSLVRMVNTNHCPGGGKPNCASVEELLLNSL